MSRHPRMMEQKHFRALLRACKDRHRNTAKRDFHLFLFLGRTGLRISEALSLRVRDLYLAHDPPFCAVRTLKRKDSRIDEVLLDAPASRGIARYLRRVLPAVLGRRVYDQDALFPAGLRHRWPTAGEIDPDRPPMTRRNALELFRYYARRAGLPPGMTLHSLRHYRGTQLYEKTRDLEFTREQLRHARLDTTQQYLHTSPEQIRRHLERLGGKK